MSKLLRMVTFSLLISRAVSKHALTPLEILLLKVRPMQLTCCSLLDVYMKRHNNNQCLIMSFTLLEDSHMLQTIKPGFSNFKTPDLNSHYKGPSLSGVFGGLRACITFMLGSGWRGVSCERTCFDCPMLHLSRPSLHMYHVAPVDSAIPKLRQCLVCGGLTTCISFTFQRCFRDRMFNNVSWWLNPSFLG